MRFTSGPTLKPSAAAVTLSMVVKLDTSRAATPLICMVAAVISRILRSVSGLSAPFSLTTPTTIVSS
ncbi:MAG: hypothetical protein HYY79_03380 [Betaproteobacteria bacterium]|nr:hypothetical protein [Betaproteobacteria bacterium]